MLQEAEEAGRDAAELLINLMDKLSFFSAVTFSFDSVRTTEAVT